MDTATRLPMRWPCGPLEDERAAAAGVTPLQRAALRAWADPRLLELLAGSPVNCLVVPWADGDAERDAAHQRAVGPLVAAARRRGLSLVGWAGARADPRRALEAAREAGLDAVATDAAEAPLDPAMLRFRERELADRSPGDFLGAFGPAWPGLRVEERRDADAESGPTGPPWLDSNAWYVRLARTLVRPRVVWLAFDPPEIGQAVAADSYVQAVADTSIFGARWVVSLDPHLRAALAAGEPRALGAWSALGRGLAFFEAHRSWSGFGAVEQIGVLSDFAGANSFLAFEVLNLLARQGGLARILDRRRPESLRLDGLDAVLYVDAAAPERELARSLHAFAEAGGALVAPPGWDERGEPLDGPYLPRFRVLRRGAGRLAVAREDFADPYLLADDAQLVMSHRHDRLRIFNPGTSQSHYAVSGDGGAGVLHTLVYQPPTALMPTSVWFRRAWREARAWSLDREAGAPVPRRAAEEGVEFEPPPNPVYWALELFA